MYFQSKSVDVLARKYLNHLSSEVGVNLESGLGRQLIDVGVEQVVLQIDLLEQHSRVEQVGLVHVNVVCVVPLERFRVDKVLNGRCFSIAAFTSATDMPSEMPSRSFICGLT